MTTRYEWNTGRHYTPEGQRIVAEVTADTVSFFDASRGIYGTMERTPWLVESPDAVRSFVMSRYDNNKYSSGAEAYEFFLRCVGYGGKE
jgi:hypothetical protein